ncbi:CU044_5270 family protein [Rugosimonospora africana]|uniref:CU044_5270 family protein n=1 Tax=Rugosimonospora africana TaxID=556532 RepID=A0A8J3QUA9_9ACTN|nr:CU044_5270 family protein [Rugosimonospora africana]GIH14976.1 hypothetical protein Raf01_31480 [Rugosimonospora africana]
MDDLRLLREVERDRPLRTLEELAAQRSLLLEATRADPAGVRAHPTRRTRPAGVWAGWLGTARRRLWAVFAAAVGTLAVVAAAMLLLVPGKGGGDQPARSGSATEAILVLQRAAAKQAGLPDVVPRPDQFVYTKTGGPGGFREAWWSVDGTRDGLIQGSTGVTTPVAGCRDGRAAAVKGDEFVPGKTEPCTPSPAYQPDLPTDPDAMMAYLYQHGGEPGDPNATGKAVLTLLQEQYVRPPAREALFEAAARIPGLRLIPNVTDGAGRTGVGVAWSEAGKNGLLIFDPKDYSLLDSGTGAGGDAVIRQAIVNEVGQRG